MRIDYFQQPLNDRLKWTLGPHHLFNSALVLGIIAVKDPHSRRSQGILEDLVAYCAIQRDDVWLNEFALAEVKIIELCVSKVQKFRNNHTPGNSAPVSQSGSDVALAAPSLAAVPGPQMFANSHEDFNSPNTALSTGTIAGMPWQAP